jgi:malate/lactate dehydrogenase
LNAVGGANTKVLVVGNPANTNCLIMASGCPRLPKKNFSALTRLDHNRARAQIALKASVGVSAVSNVCIWGNHSSTQFPDVAHGSVRQLPSLMVFL